ncbi:uncharacterized protein I303_106843 [Kwoniella dejecticola CBS 10117]|uniref:FAD-binding domain-containing protein n=1 Tax=Kwoniella dejecticola CBS 10117 TaxID=1296121 RepID=A0A1A5ZTJ4_9TREE|nr:uncharacterized protein I303_08516 [Kwoniella dejecticola CBS 10117]OBR81133.1 hypothetical protein I303_08516 [Kwoniella dejecticola CBS 10117]
MQPDQPTEQATPDISPGSRFQILVVGAGIAGSSFCYALKRSKAYKNGLIGSRIIEKTTAPSTDLGFPIHLSSEGRQALRDLLDPSDLVRLHDAQGEIPVYHDGITISKYKGKRVYRLIRDPGVRPMIEREDLLRIFRDDAGDEVEYGRQVKEMIQIEENGKKRVRVVLDNKEEMVANLVVGADGMFSSIRHLLSEAGPRHIHQREKETKPRLENRDMLEKLPWTVINTRTSSPEVLKWISDPYGINSIYGESFSATMIPLNPRSADHKGQMPHADRKQDTHATEEGALEVSTSNSVSITRNTKISVVSDSSPLNNDIKAATKSRTDEGSHIDMKSNTAKPTDNEIPPRSSGVYVAVTVPSKWLTTEHDTKLTKEETKNPSEPSVHSKFLRDLETSEEWSKRKEFKLYSLSKTFGGEGRIVLIGDAAHGTIPFCGSGTGSAIADSVRLVEMLEGYLEESRSGGCPGFIDI